MIEVRAQGKEVLTETSVCQVDLVRYQDPGPSAGIAGRGVHTEGLEWAVAGWIMEQQWKAGARCCMRTAAVQ